MIADAEKIPILIIRRVLDFFIIKTIESQLQFSHPGFFPTSVHFDGWRYLYPVRLNNVSPTATVAIAYVDTRPGIPVEPGGQPAVIKQDIIIKRVGKLAKPEADNLQILRRKYIVRD